MAVGMGASVEHGVAEGGPLAMVADGPLSLPVIVPLFGPLNVTVGLAVVDAEDADIAGDFVWRMHPHGYACRYAKQKTILMHREILTRFAGANPPGMVADHADGDRRNNRRENLRWATHSQNSQNRRAWGRSRFLGVYWRKDREKWAAMISSAGHQRHIGLFDDEADAARAYDEYAAELHGAFARLNFPEEIR